MTITVSSFIATIGFLLAIITAIVFAKRSSFSGKFYLAMISCATGSIVMIVMLTANEKPSALPDHVIAMKQFNDTNIVGMDNANWQFGPINEADIMIRDAEHRLNLPPDTLYNKIRRDISHQFLVYCPDGYEIKLVPKTDKEATPTSIP